jgi:hypothetical protein
MPKQVKELPVVKINAVREVTSEEFDLAMEDHVFDLFVKYGKKIATPSDLFKIGFVRAVEDTIKYAEKNKAAKKKKKRAA